MGPLTKHPSDTHLTLPPSAPSLEKREGVVLSGFLYGVLRRVPSLRGWRAGGYGLRSG